MSLLDKFLKKRGYVKRDDLARVWKRGYAAAKMDGTTSDWLTGQSASADYDVRSALVTVRTRARDLYQNNAYARKYILMVDQNVIGADGFILQLKARDQNGALDTIANDIIETAFWRWAEKKYASIDGQLSFRGVQSLIMRTVARDGECFIRKVSGKNVNDFGFTLQVIEPDFIDETYNENLPNGNFVRMGVELNSDRRPVAYYLTVVPKGADLYTNMISGRERVRIPASEMIHLYDRERANQTRGISWMATAAVQLQQLVKFEEYALINARISASKMGFFTSQDGAQYKGDGEDEQGRFTIKAEAGVFEQLEPGMSFTPFSPQFPEAQHEPFVKSMLRGTAAGLGVSYNTLANDLEGVNYSSIRAGLLDERDHWKKLQAWFTESFLNDVFAEWLDWALMMGQIGLPQAKYDKYNAPTWIGRRWTWVDPMKDVAANIEAVKAGFKTAATVIAEQGGDLIETYAQLAEEKRLRIRYGLDSAEAAVGAGAKSFSKYGIEDE